MVSRLSLINAGKQMVIGNAYLLRMSLTWQTKNVKEGRLTTYSTNFGLRTGINQFVAAIWPICFENVWLQWCESMEQWCKVVSHHCKVILQSCKCVLRWCEVVFQYCNALRINTKSIFITAASFCNGAGRNCIEKRKCFQMQEALLSLYYSCSNFSILCWHQLQYPPLSSAAIISHQGIEPSPPLHSSILFLSIALSKTYFCFSDKLS